MVLKILWFETSMKLIGSHFCSFTDQRDAEIVRQMALLPKQWIKSSVTLVGSHVFRILVM